MSMNIYYYMFTHSYVFLIFVGFYNRVVFGSCARLAPTHVHLISACNPKHFSFSKYASLYRAKSSPQISSSLNDRMRDVFVGGTLSRLLISYNLWSVQERWRESPSSKERAAHMYAQTIRETSTILPFFGCFFFLESQAGDCLQAGFLLALTQVLFVGDAKGH